MSWKAERRASITAGRIGVKERPAIVRQPDHRFDHATSPRRIVARTSKAVRVGAGSPALRLGRRGPHRPVRPYLLRFRGLGERLPRGRRTKRRSAVSSNFPTDNSSRSRKPSAMPPEMVRRRHAQDRALAANVVFCVDYRYEDCGVAAIFNAPAPIMETALAKVCHGTAERLLRLAAAARISAAPADGTATSRSL